MSNISNNLDKFISLVNIIKPMNSTQKLQLKNICNKHKQDFTIINKTVIFLYGQNPTEDEYSRIYHLRLNIINEIKLYPELL